MSNDEIDSIDPTQGPGGSQQQPTDPTVGSTGQSSGNVSPTDSDYSKASSNFFPDMPMTKEEFKQFMENLLKMISVQIQSDTEKMKKANDDLKSSETGDGPN